MAVSIPSDLIRKIQAKLRDGAGLPNYDPADPALRFFPSSEETDWAIETATFPCPDVISFNSTDAYRTLLKSLHLDGSEIVSMNSQSKDSRKDHSEGDGMILHDYLNIQIGRQIEGERDQKISSVAEPAQSTYTLNLSGIDLEDYFSDAKKETNISFDGNASESESFDFFVKSEPTKPSDKDNSVSAWDVEFPSTDPYPWDPFQEKSVEKQEDSGKLHPTSEAWDLDDLWPTSSSTVPVNPSKFQEDDDLYDDWQDFTGSKNADFTSNISPDSGSGTLLPKESNDFEDIDFGSFVQYSESSTQQNNVFQPHDLLFDGMNGWDEMKVAPSKDSTGTVDNLLSTMNDLSFI